MKQFHEPKSTNVLHETISIKNYIMLLFLMLLYWHSYAQPNVDQKDAIQPNVIFIMMEGVGYGDLSSYGNKKIQTPNLDRLAKEGIKITNFYAASPICSPSRVAAITGQQPERWHINSYLASRKQNEKRHMANYLDPKAPSIARAFQHAGYATAHFGKWHMGGGADVGNAPLPQAYGYDQSLVSITGLGDRILPKGKKPWTKQSLKLGHGNTRVVKKWKMTGIFVDSTIAFIMRHKDQPFYIDFWPMGIHDPYNPKPEWRKKFPRFTSDHYEQDFLATLWNLDRQVGRLLDKLDELGLSKNTIVVLTSDHGPTDWRYYYKQGYYPPGSAQPFRGRKWSLYEGGIRVPFLVRWPGHIPAGGVDAKTMMTDMDLFPTLSSLANVKLPNVDFDGQDMSEALLGNPQQRRKPLFWEFGPTETYLAPGNPRFKSPDLAMRDGKWKLLINHDASDPELYNLQEDIAETKNVANEYPEITRKLSQKLMNWWNTLPLSQYY